MELTRRKFQGVLNILSFNRHFYWIGLLALVLIALSFFIFSGSVGLFWLVVLAFGYGLLMPLAVSAYVYDFSWYYEMNWLKKMNLEDGPDNVIVNINAGFDETSFILQRIFPKSELKVFDFYNEKRHTEAAIIRARKVSLVYPNTQIMDTELIPLADKSVDIIFLLSAAHEIRSQAEQIQFLTECHRVCKSTANVIMVEHLRDIPNFLAFSVGFMHFFSKKNWKQVMKKAGFTSFKETKFTPFMSVFNGQP
jgi:hypothetical protein